MKYILTLFITLLIFSQLSYAQKDENTIIGSLVMLKHEAVSVYIASDKTEQDKKNYNRVVSLVNGFIFDIMAESSRRNSVKVYRKLDKRMRQKGFKDINMDDVITIKNRFSNYLRRVIKINAAMLSLSPQYAQKENAIDVDASFSDLLLTIPDSYFKIQDARTKKVNSTNKLIMNAMMASASDLDEKLKK